MPYVDRDHVRDMLHREIEAWGSSAEEIDALLKANDELFKLPEADVAPVVYGEWNVKYPLRECGCCGEIYTELGGNDGKAWNYCPNCGAKMDGDRDA